MKDRDDYDFERIAVDQEIAGCAIVEFIPACPVDLILPNPWNPNEQDDFQYAKTRESLRKNKFVHNLVVREVWIDDEFDHYQLLDGEHRLSAAKDEGFQSAPCNNLGRIPDMQAKKLALILAANRGELNPIKLSKMVTELEQELAFDEFVELPFTEEEFDRIRSYYDVSWKEVDVADIFKKSASAEAKGKKDSKTSNLLKMACSFPREKKEIVSSAFDKYAIENNIMAPTPEEKRGKIIMHIFETHIYPKVAVGDKQPKVRRRYQDEK